MFETIVMRCGRRGPSTEYQSHFRLLKSERRDVWSDTMSNYMNAAEKASLFYKAPREDAVGKQRLAFNDKWHVVDQGLRQAMGMSDQANIDQVLEGIVFMERRN